MTLEVPTASYLLDPDADVATVVRALGLDAGEIGEATGPAHGRGGPESETTTLVLLDTADRLLRAAGLELVATSDVHHELAGPGRGSPGRRPGETAPSDGAAEPGEAALVTAAAPAVPGRARAAPPSVATAVADATGSIRPGVGEVLLVLRGRAGDPPLRAVAPRARRYLIPELPAGTLRDRLEPIVEIRALLPIVELRRQEIPAAVRNREGKIVVRLAIARVSAQPAASFASGGDRQRRMAAGRGDGDRSGTGQGRAGTAAGLLPPPTEAMPVPLHTRIEVTGVLGYPKPFARVQKTLTSPPLSLAEATETVADEAVMALGGVPQGLSGKVDVGLRPDDRADVAAVRILRSLAHVVESNLPGTIEDLDTEFLHDLRVAVRKSRSVLRELKRAFEPGDRQTQADALRWVQAVTGPTRDLDVQLLEWDELTAHLPDERRQHLEPVRGLLRERRADAFAALAATLESDAFRQRWSGWRAFLAGDLGPEDERPDAALPVQEVAGRRIRTVYKRMVRMGQAIDDTSPAQALHDLRKRGKELRYLLELFGGLWPPATIKPVVAKLKGLQNVLGLHQDREVQALQLRTLAPDVSAVPGSGADALLAMGSLIDKLEADHQAARHRFAEWFTPFTQVELPR